MFGFGWLKSIFGGLTSREAAAPQTQNFEPTPLGINDWIAQSQNSGNASVKELASSLANLPKETQARAIVETYLNGSEQIPPYAVADALDRIVAAFVVASASWCEAKYAAVLSTIKNAPAIITKAIKLGDTGTISTVMSKLGHALGAVTERFWDDSGHGAREATMQIIHASRGKTDDASRNVFEKSVRILAARLAYITRHACCCYEHDSPKVMEALFCLQGAGQTQIAGQTAEDFLTNRAIGFSSGDSFADQIKRFGQFLDAGRKENFIRELLATYVKMHLANNPSRGQEFVGKILSAEGYIDSAVVFYLQAASSGDTETAKRITDRLRNSGLQDKANLAYASYLSKLQRYVDLEAGKKVISLDEYAKAKNTPFEVQALEFARYEIGVMEKTGNFWGALTIARGIGAVDKVSFYARLGVK